MINSFRGENYFLSNFYTLANPIVCGWMLCATSEHLFQALKATDNHLRVWVLNAETPGIAKARGKAVQLREGWGSGLDKAAMHLALILKFTANNDLLVKLIRTENKRLIEGNTWCDNYWGDCTCVKCTNKPGLNNLGILLTQVRSLFQQLQSHIRTE